MHDTQIRKPSTYHCLLRLQLTCGCSVLALHKAALQVCGASQLKLAPTVWANIHGVLPYRLCIAYGSLVFCPRPSPCGAGYQRRNKTCHTSHSVTKHLLLPSIQVTCVAGGDNIQVTRTGATFTGSLTGVTFRSPASLGPSCRAGGPPHPTWLRLALHRCRQHHCSQPPAWRAVSIPVTAPCKASHLLPNPKCLLYCPCRGAAMDLLAVCSCWYGGEWDT